MFVLHRSCKSLPILVRHAGPDINAAGKFRRRRDCDRVPASPGDGDFRWLDIEDDEPFSLRSCQRQNGQAAFHPEIAGEPDIQHFVTAAGVIVVGASVAPGGPFVAFCMGLQKVPAGQLEAEEIADRTAGKSDRDGSGFRVDRRQRQGGEKFNEICRLKSRARRNQFTAAPDLRPAPFKSQAALTSCVDRNGGDSLVIDTRSCYTSGRTKLHQKNVQWV